LAMDLLVKTGLSETLGIGLHNLDVSHGDHRGYHTHTVYEHTKRVVEIMKEIVEEREAEGIQYTSDEKVGLYLSAMMHDAGKAKSKSIVCAEKKCKFKIPIEELERANAVADYDVNTFVCPTCSGTKAKVIFIGHENHSAKFVNNMRGVFNNGILDVVEATVLNHMKRYDPKSTDKTIMKRQREFGRNTEWILMLQEADHSSKGEDVRDAWKLEVDKYRLRLAMKTPVTGRDIMDMFDLQPGPQVGRVIDELNKLAVQNSKFGIPHSAEALKMDQLAQLLSDEGVSSWDELVEKKRTIVLEYLKLKTFNNGNGVVDKRPMYNGRELMQFFGIDGGSWISKVQRLLIESGHVSGGNEREAKAFLKSIDIDTLIDGGVV